MPELGRARTADHDPVLTGHREHEWVPEGLWLCGAGISVISFWLGHPVLATVLLFSALGFRLVVARKREHKRQQNLDNLKATREALLESEVRFRDAFEFSGSGMAMVNLDGTLSKVNRQLCRILGQTREELLNRVFEDYTHPEDVGLEDSLFSEMIEGQRRSYQIEKRYLRSNGGLVWVRLTVALIRSGDGEPASLISQVEDITPQKDLESELKDARDRALDASRLKSEFLAGMSHEVRTPMNGIIGMSALLMETLSTDEQREMGQVIQGSAENLMTIINDILDFSKIEAGKMRIERSEFDLQEVVEDCLALLAPRAHEKKIELLNSFDEQIDSLLWGDSSRIRQVLINLVGNAIKFTETGEVAVNICRMSESQGYMTIRIEIIDTGIGIPLQAQRHLFQPFVQGEGGTTRRYGGTGLGLSICRQLVELMGGEIGFSSSEGKGTTFWIELTLLRKGPHRTVARDFPEGMRILFVDDNANNRRILGSQLQRFGLIGHGVASAPEAMQHLLSAAHAGNPYPIALLDWHMPDSDGVDLAIAIRRDPLLQDMLLLLLSSAAILADASTMKLAAFDGQLTKPVREKQLHRLLLQSLGKRDENEPNDVEHEGPHVETSPRGGPPRTQAPLSRVLVADDNRVNQLVAHKLLTRINCAVDIVSNGKEALEMAASNTYEAILMDCQMPVMDGYEATRQIRSGEPGIDPRVTIIALTAYAMESDRLKCLDAGMDDYLAKPLREHELRMVFLRNNLQIVA